MRPLLRSVIGSSLSMLVGDSLCQLFQTRSLDLERSGRMLLVSTLISGPVNHYVFVLIEHIFPGKSLQMIMRKVATQIAVSPLVISLTLFSVSLLKYRDVSLAVLKVRTTVFSTWFTGLLYWPFVSVALFRCISPLNRPVGNSVAGALWKVYVSAVANRPLTEAKTREPDPERPLR